MLAVLSAGFPAAAAAVLVLYVVAQAVVSGVHDVLRAGAAWVDALPVAVFLLVLELVAVDVAAVPKSGLMLSGVGMADMLHADLVTQTACLYAFVLHVVL